MCTISLEGMEFFAHHGCFPEERIIGSRFLVDLWLTSDTAAAEVSDNLSQTINYQAAYEIVRQEMEIKSHILEHVAARILEAAFREFPYLEKATVRVSKMNPPVGGKVGKVSVEITRSR